MKRCTCLPRCCSDPSGLEQRFRSAVERLDSLWEAYPTSSLPYHQETIRTQLRQELGAIKTQREKWASCPGTPITLGYDAGFGVCVKADTIEGGQRVTTMDSGWFRVITYDPHSGEWNIEAETTDMGEAASLHDAPLATPSDSGVHYVSGFRNLELMDDEFGSVPTVLEPLERFRHLDLGEEAPKTRTRTPAVPHASGWGYVLDPGVDDTSDDATLAYIRKGQTFCSLCLTADFHNGVRPF